MKKCSMLVAAAVLSFVGQRNARAAFVQSSIPLDWQLAPNLHAALSSSDNGVSEVITLPFAFPFMDEVFTEIRINTNGFVTLGPGAPSCGACSIPRHFISSGQPQAPNYILAPWWADWNPALGGDIFFGTVDNGNRFAVEWWFVRPNGAPAGATYAFSLQLFKDGRFDFLYLDMTRGFSPFDNGNTGSIGFQPRSASRFASSVSFTTGSGGVLGDNTARSFRRAADNALPLTSFNQDSQTPDIVERWAPVIWADVTSGDRCDYLAAANFDGDWRGSNNSVNMFWNLAALLRGAVYWSRVQTATHDIIGYYFYHAHSCGPPFDNHEHDMEGVVIAVNRITGTPDMMLTNVHGRFVPYKSPYDSSLITVTPHQTAYQDSPTFTFFPASILQVDPPATTYYDTIAVGIESSTHAVWGRWHNRCVIGAPGSPSGCNFSHGGDGIIYTYANFGDQPSSHGQYPNWPRFRYDLLPVSDLFAKAHMQSYCGQNQATALYRCDGHGTPWDRFNADGNDAGDPPWAWGLDGILEPANACTQRNMLIQPGFMFRENFDWPSTQVEACSYVANEYQTSLTCAPGVTPPGPC